MESKMESKIGQVTSDISDIFDLEGLLLATKHVHFYGGASLLSLFVYPNVSD